MATQNVVEAVAELGSKCYREREELRAALFQTQEAAKHLLGKSDRHGRALREICEVWAGAECGEPVLAQEAYAIHLCKQMYALAAEALTPNV